MSFNTIEITKPEKIRVPIYIFMLMVYNINHNFGRPNRVYIQQIYSDVVCTLFVALLITSQTYVRARRSFKAQISFIIFGSYKNT